MNHHELHSALKTTVVAQVADGGIEYKHVRLQHGKDSFLDTLHAHPSSFTSSGPQTTDLLPLLGFQKSPCAFHVARECYCRAIPENGDAAQIAAAVAAAFCSFDTGVRELENCGVHPRAVAIGRRVSGLVRTRGDGHVAPKSERMKESEDEFFRFVFTFIDGAGDKGWTTHYRAKHMPLAPEFQAALDFLGGFSRFAECPEFDFDGCWWRFTPFESGGHEAFRGNVDYAHRCFDAHAAHFSRGLQALLTAHAALAPQGLSFLEVAPQQILESEGSEPEEHREVPPRGEGVRRYDVAISFAGPEREHAEELATRVRAAGFEVFYDGFYPEQLWGRDLVSLFDRVYRKEARHCVMFISREYAKRMWTNHERRSAQARALEDKGSDYILPIRTDDTDLDGLPPTVGYLSLSEFSVGQIAELLVEKLRGSATSPRVAPPRADLNPWRKLPAALTGWDTWRILIPTAADTAIADTDEAPYHCLVGGVATVGFGEAGGGSDGRGLEWPSRGGE